MNPAPVCRAEFLANVISCRVIIVQRDRNPKSRPLRVLSFDDSGMICTLKSLISNDVARFPSEDALLQTASDMGLESIKIPLKIGQSTTYLTQSQCGALKATLA